MKGKLKDPAKDSEHKGKSTYALKVREGRQMYGGFQRKMTTKPRGGEPV